MLKKSTVIACLITFIISACSSSKNLPTVSGHDRVPVNQKAELIFK